MTKLRSKYYSGSAPISFETAIEKELTDTMDVSGAAECAAAVASQTAAALARLIAALEENGTLETEEALIIAGVYGYDVVYE